MSEEHKGDLVQGSEFTTATCYDPKVKARAYELYLTSDYTLTDIAIAVGVGKQVVQTWANKGGWRNRKLELEQEEIHRAEDKYRQIILANRAPVAERHIRISGKLEEAVETFADKLKEGALFSDSEMKAISKLKQLAEALTGASGVGARAVGISDRPNMDPAESSKQGAKNKRQPLIVIGVTAQPAPGREGQMPQVTVKETTYPDEEQTNDFTDD